MIRTFFTSVIVYALLIFLMRLTGKRQLGQLELSELVVTFLISEVASEPIMNPDISVLHIIIPILTLLGLEYLLSFVSLKSVKLRAILSGKPALLIVHGRIDQSQMNRNRITPDELTEALRSDGVLDLNDVEYAILETNGRINIIPTPQERPATAGQLGVTEPDAGYPIIVINNGRVLSDNLRLLGYDENWLKKRLAENGLSAPSEVYMMTVDQKGGIFLAPRE
ncbi:MAG: DUF421 domain-containing protein [Oscillospiraceae bacterium]